MPNANGSQSNLSLLPTKEIIEKHARSGPRYTSYPTAPHWRHDFTEHEYEQALAKYRENPTSSAVYVHIPFCKTLCLYCGCNVHITNSQDKVERYLKAVDREVEMLNEKLGQRLKPDSLHWGGGTPTYLNPDQLTTLFHSLEKAFDFSAAKEIALEVDPRVTDVDHVRALSDLGFNRISMGLQDFDPHVQEIVNRVQSKPMTEQLVNDCRKHGLDSISIDLIYGLPDQTLQGFDKTLDDIIEIRPQRISLFGYAHVPWMKKHQKVLEKYHIPEPRERVNIYQAATEKLMGAGYEIIGMDHFALPDDDMVKMLKAGTLHRNFMGYTTQASEALFSFGPSSIGDVAGTYVQNSRDTMDYISRVEAGHLPVNRGIALNEDDLIRRAVINEFMCNLRLNPQKIAQLYQIDFHEYFQEEIELLNEPIQDGLLFEKNNVFILSESGRLLVRNICMIFDRYLQKEQGESQPIQRYSKTV